MTDPLRVVHVVNRADDTTVPWQMVAGMRDRGIDAGAVAWYGRRGENDPVTGLEARTWWDPAAARRLTEHLRAEEPDVLHLHHTASAAAGAMAALRAGRPPTVKTEHGSRERKRLGQQALDLMSLTMSDVVVANSDATIASFRPWERELTRGKRRRIYNGVDVEAIAAAGEEIDRRRSRGFGERAVVVSVGRLIAEKNHRRLLRAVRIVLERDGPNLRLDLLGDGPLRAVLEEEVRELGLAGRVDLRGQVNRGDVYRQLWRSDLFVVPSLSEGFCNAAVEAMAAGLPVVASDVPALREVVGAEGRYFDPTRPRAIADAILDVLSWPPERRRRTGRVLQRRARGHFSLSRTIGEHLSLYRELTGRDGRGRGE